MDKQARAGFITNIDGAMKFWERRAEAEKALGSPLTREEQEKLLIALNIGEEVSMEDLLDMIKGKKVLMIKDKKSDSL